MGSSGYGKGYYAYVIIGLIAVVAISIIAGTNSKDATGQDVLPIIIGSVAVFVVGLLVLQWRAVLRRRAPEGPDPHAALAGKGSDDAGQVGSYDELMSMMATEDYDEARMRRGRSRAFGVVGANQLLITIVTVGCLILGYLGATGKLPNPGNGEWTPYAPFVLLPFAFAWVYFMMSRSGEAASDQLAPLGLQVAEMPKPGVRPVPWGSGMQSDVRGATVLRGRRHGHDVEVRMDGSRHTTTVHTKSPGYEIDVRRNKLVAGDGAPASVVKAVEGLTPSKRWSKLKSVKGGPDGIVAERKVDAQQGWLWDLWLCERLAGAGRG